MIHHLYLAAGQQNPLIPDLAELIIGAIAFVIVFAILCKVLYPRIATTLEERTDAIEGGLKRAEDAQAEAQPGARGVPGAAGRRPARKPRGCARRPGRRAPRSSPRCASRARPSAQRLVEAAHAQIEADRQQAMQRAAGRGRRARGGSGRPDRRGVAGGRGPAAPDGGALPRRAGRAVRADRPGPGPSHEGREPGVAGGSRRGAAGCPGRRGQRAAGSATSCSR